MEPVSTIGLIGAVFGVADIIAKSVSSLLDLQSRYKVADLKVSLLVQQLSTLKAALGHIADMIKDDLAFSEQGQLINDLYASLHGCDAIIAVLDGRLSMLRRNDNGGLERLSKISLLWDKSTINDYLNMLNNHINALHLLVAVFRRYANHKMVRMVMTLAYHETQWFSAGARRYSRRCFLTPHL